MEPSELDPEAFGEILNTMIAAGASNEVLGKFALMFRNKHLAAMPAPVVEMGPVLEAFATKVAAKIQGGPPLQANVTARSVKASKPSNPLKIVKISVNGAVTSVCLPPDMFQKAQQVFGSAKAANQLIQQLATQAPPDTRRSAYVQAKLTQALVAAAAQAHTQSPAAGHMH